MPIHWFIIGALWILLGALVVLQSQSQTLPQTFQQTPSNYISIQERRMPCGNTIRREVIHQNDAWRKTVTMLDAEGRVLATKTRTIEPEQCAKIQAGQFVPDLWRDCTL
jgi:hypothetical protein